MNYTPPIQLLERAPGCYYILLNNDLTIKAANNSFKNLFESTITCPGKSFLSLFCPLGEQQWRQLLTEIHLNQESTQSQIIPLETKEGTFNIKWNVCGLMNEAKDLSGFEILGVILEKSDMPDGRNKSVVEKEEYYRSLFDNNPDGVFLFNLEGKLIKANGAFAKITEYSIEELLNTSYTTFIDPERIDEVKKYFTEATTGVAQNYESMLITKNNKRIFVNVTNIPLIDKGTIVGVTGIVKNITKRILAQRALIKQESRLKSVLTKLKKILDSSLDIICTLDENGKFIKVSAACRSILGYEPRQLVGRNYADFVYEEDVSASIEKASSVKKGLPITNFVNRFYKKDGTLANLVWSSRWDDVDKRFYSIARDATEKKESEAALRASEEKYRILFYNHPLPVWIYDADTFKFIEVNEAAVKHYGYTRSEFLNMKLQDILVGEEVEKFNTLYGQKDYYKRQHKGLWIHKKKNNEILYAEITSNYINFEDRPAKLVLSIDRTEQVMAEKELIKSNERYLFLSDATFDAIYDLDMVTGEVQWNEGVKKMFEIKDTMAIKSREWWLENLHEEDRQRVQTKLENHINDHLSVWEDEYRFKTGDTYKYIYDRGYIIYNESNKPIRLIGAMQDHTERKAHENMLKKLNNSLEKRARELAESNAELERFAYVASHDLQEPLRMVTSFLQLLEKRYKDKLDQKAHEYISYAVDGAERMKRLILDLLEYSRVNSSKIEKEDVNLNEVINDLKRTYKSILQETGGTINAGELPVVKGNKTQILQLFQNLIGNAFKYKSDKPPVVTISYEEDPLNYKFSIMDNGIGIDPKFFGKIFIIFQRLHNREQYSGTGIGLAICKKIIDKHGGRIWVNSALGQGSTFYFTLPKSK